MKPDNTPRLTEFVNTTGDPVTLEGAGHIDPNEFRKQATRQFDVKIGTVQHLYRGSHPITIGRVYGK